MINEIIEDWYNVNDKLIGPLEIINLKKEINEFIEKEIDEIIPFAELDEWRWAELRINLKEKLLGNSPQTKPVPDGDKGRAHTHSFRRDGTEDNSPNQKKLNPVRSSGEDTDVNLKGGKS